MCIIVLSSGIFTPIFGINPIKTWYKNILLPNGTQLGTKITFFIKRNEYDIIFTL